MKVWGVGLNTKPNSFIFIPTIIYRWCNTGCCMDIAVRWGNIEVSVGRRTLDIEDLLEEDNEEQA